jgi:two-component system chemotaxis response regulator CheB
MADKLGVLVVDDSAFMRKVISQIINGAEDFCVVATARNGLDALDKIAELGPQVQLVTLDIQMPEMDGLTCLREIMQRHPRRVVMVSSLTTEGASETLQALEYGAIDFLAKPGGAISLSFEKVGLRLLEILRVAARSRLPVAVSSLPPESRETKRAAGSAGKPSSSAVTAHTEIRPSAGSSTVSKLVAIASSTGGPKALNTLIPMLPRNLPAPVIVVQHMPATFTRLLADRLDRFSELEVKEAQDGDRLVDGHCYIAPGGKHLELLPGETLRLTNDPPIGGLRPCADITFHTVASVYGARALGVVLTGMGRDGTEGCSAMRKRGSHILAESKETALIYGMPKSVVDAGLADRSVPIERMAQAIADYLQGA